MPLQGTIERWEAERGFGFIRCEGRSLFFHVKDFHGDAQPPTQGMAVLFEEIHVGGKGPRAMAVRPLVSARSPQRLRPASRIHGGGRRPAPREVKVVRVVRDAPIVPTLLLIGAWVAVLAWAGWQRRLPTGLLLALVPLNVLTFFTYWLDKNAARRKTWRTREDHLHLLALLGGWPGAWLAQQLLRHKSVKASFQQAFWLSVVLHGAALAAWLWWAPAAGLLTSG